MLASTPGQSALDLYQVCLTMVSSLNSHGIKSKNILYPLEELEKKKANSNMYCSYQFPVMVLILINIVLEVAD